MRGSIHLAMKVSGAFLGILFAKWFIVTLITAYGAFYVIISLWAVITILYWMIYWLNL